MLNVFLIFVLIIVFGGFTLITRFFGIRAYTYQTKDMEPIILKGNKVVVYNKAYLNKKPLLSDIVTLVPSENDSKLYVRRIVGLPEETIEIENQHIKVPKGYYYVSADNKDDSDSRNWGAIPAINIKGEVILIYSGRKCTYNKFQK